MPASYWLTPGEEHCCCCRRSLVGALKGGSTLAISFHSLQNVNLAQFFDVGDDSAS